MPLYAYTLVLSEFYIIINGVNVEYISSSWNDLTDSLNGSYARTYSRGASTVDNASKCTNAHSNSDLKFLNFRILTSNFLIAKDDHAHL